MDDIKKYIIYFDDYSMLNNIILYIKQDVNRPNNPTDDELI